MLSICPGVSWIYTPSGSFHLRFPCISAHPPSLIPPLFLRYLRTPTVADSLSVSPVSPYTHHRSLMIYIEAVIELVWRCTWRPRTSELREALGGRERSSLEMHWEAVIERVLTCTWRPRWSQLTHALGGRDRVNSEMRLAAVIKRVWTCPWRPWVSNFGHALGGHDWASLDMHLEAAIEWTQRSTLRLWPSGFGDPLSHYDRARLEEYLEAAVDLGIMLYLVYAVLGVNSWLWHGGIERNELTSCS